MAQDLNSIVLVGRLTKDPDLTHFPSGGAVCAIRLAYSTRAKDDSGNWTDKSNYIDVKVFGKAGAIGKAESLAQNLAKGRRIAVQGRLEFEEWDSEHGRRSKHVINAFDVQYLDPKQDGGGGGSSVPAGDFAPVGATQESGLGPAGASTDDDIPF